MRPGSRFQAPGMHIYLRAKEGLSHPWPTATPALGSGSLIAESAAVSLKAGGAGTPFGRPQFRILCSSRLGRKDS